MYTTELFTKHTVLIILLLGLVVACGGKEERKVQHLERGLQYLAENNYEKARIEFKNAGQIDPKEAQVYWRLGAIEEHNGGYEKAFEYYATAIELDAELIQPRLKVAEIYIAHAAASRSRSDTSAEANALGLASEQIKEILARDANHPEGMLLQATLWLQEGETEKAIQQLESLIARNAGHQSVVVLLARLYTQNKRASDAETVLVNAVKQASDNQQLREILARFYEHQGKNNKAEQTFRSLVEAFPENSDHRISLAAFLARSRQYAEAEVIIREAISIDPANESIYSQLVNLILADRGIDTAIDELVSVTSSNPNLTALQFSLVGLYRKNDQDTMANQLLEKMIDIHGTKPKGLRARVILADWLANNSIQEGKIRLLLEEVLKENPQDFNALLLRGRIDVSKSNWLDAINDYRLVMKQQPDSVELLKLLAVAYTGNKDLDLAKDTLVRVIKLAPEDIESRLQLANLLAEQEDGVRMALEQLETVLEQSPGHLKALALKFDLLALVGDVKGMMNIAMSMQKFVPESEDGFIREARLLVAQKKYDEAVLIVNRVLAKNPDSIDGLLIKTDILTAQRAYGEALNTNRQLRELRPESAISYLREARLLRARQDNEGAIRAYKIALDKAQDLTDALTELVDLEVSSGKTAEAKTRLTELLKKSPDHPVANNLLGIVLYREKDYRSAEQVFLKQLLLEGKNEALYSQLAGVRVARNDMQGAVSAYEAGLKVFPASLRLTVELSGIHELQGNFDTAIDLYERVLAREPDHVVSMNNLAALLSDHRTNDRKSLEKAASYAEVLSKTEHPVFRNTAGWVYYRLGEYDMALKLLLNAAEAMPSVAVFQYHLGMLRYSMGNLTAAKEHLEKALTDEPKFAGVEEARRVLSKL